MYVPKTRKNFLSVASITDLGHEVRFTKMGAEILNNAVGKGERRNNLFELSAFIANAGVDTIQL